MSFAMTKAERESFLADLHVGIVSVSQANRGPLTVPIWYIYEPGKDLWMLTSRNSRKGKLFAVAGRISLCVQTEDPPYRYVSVEGPVSITPAIQYKEQLLAMASRYLGEEGGQQYVDGSSSGADTIIVTLTPERWYSVDYSKR